MMHRQKVKLLLWFATLLSILALVVVPALAIGQFTLTVNKVGDGTGTVTSDDGKINCGDDCEETYVPQAVGKLMAEVVRVTLTATPDEGFAFAGWGQDCQCGLDPIGAGFARGTCTIIGMYDGENRTCTANFGLPVGGIVVPVNKVGLLVPWMGLVTLAGLAGLGVVLIRRRKT
ncbi:MAG: hypothetical protein WBW48_04600 [Anaerolineae bacterium]